MSLFTGSGSLPKHVYCHVDKLFVRRDHPLEEVEFEPCIWFGLQSYHGRAWGCHIMLECGAVVRNVPLHALAWLLPPAGGDQWGPPDAQVWDCYGLQFSLHEYDYLHSLHARAKLGSGKEMFGEYLFTAIPVNDAYTAEPSQSKEFMFLMLDNGRFAALPTNRVLFRDKSFTSEFADWPDDILLQEGVWSAED